MINQNLEAACTSSLRTLMSEFQRAANSNHYNDRKRIDLGHDLMCHARSYDVAYTISGLEGNYLNAVKRDFNNPVEYTDAKIEGQSWADSCPNPLEKYEEWNHGRRASNAGVAYQVKNGLPVNPFLNYGVRGRGVVGRFGPNHAVDIAPCRIMRNKQGQHTLHVLGIIRGDNHTAAICGGFIEHESAPYHNTPDIILNTQTKEMFEEMISGSIPLDVSDQSNRKQVTQEKWELVQKNDPEFLLRLKNHLSHAFECYAGPVLSSGRNTNTSWMETNLAWVMLDETDWKNVCGENPQFNYQFSAGDDAADVKWHEITPALIKDADCHAAFFCYIMASYLINTKNCPKDVLDQAKRLNSYLKSLVSSNPIVCYKL
jgi:hypothetical protein